MNREYKEPSLKYDSEKQFLLALLTGEGDQIAPERLPSVSQELNWAWLGTIININHLGPLAGYWSRREDRIGELIPPELREAMINQLSYAIRNEQVCALAIREVMAKLYEKGMRPIVLKGPALARLYPESYLRLFGDLDIMVAESEIGRVTEALGEIDYQAITFDNSTGITEQPTASGRKEAEAFGKHWHAYARVNPATRQLVEGFLPVDIHDPLHRGFGCQSLIDAGEWLERARPLEIYGVPAGALANEDALLYLCSHLHADQILRAVSSLRAVLDIYLVIRQGVDWSGFLGIFRRFAAAQEIILDWFNKELSRQGYCSTEGPWFDGCDIITNVHNGLRCVEGIFGPVVPDYVLEATRPKDECLLDLLFIPPDNLFLWKVSFAERILDYPVASPRKLVENRAVGYWRKAPPLTVWNANSLSRGVWERAPRIRP